MKDLYTGEVNFDPDLYSPDRIDWAGRTVKGHISVLGRSNSGTGTRRWECRCLLCGRGYAADDDQLADNRVLICACSTLYQ
jgi:hypothetical protein